MRKSKKRRNPELDYVADQVLDNISYKYLAEGAYGETYFFTLDKNKRIKDVLLFPGDYVLKIFLYPYDIDSFIDHSDKYIKHLKLLSNKGLIPKIYYIDRHMIIMDYIDGKTLENITLSDPIISKMWIMLNKWHSYGFYHGDIKEENIMINKNGEIWFIDPFYVKGISPKELLSNDIDAMVDIITGQNKSIRFA